MFLVGHGAVGALLGSGLAKNPIGAFLVGWASHYLVDLIPHGDEPVGEWVKKNHEVKRLFFISLIDGWLLILALGIYIWQQGINWAVILGAIGGTVPDFMWGLEKLLKRQLFGWHQKFHHKNHNAFQIKMPFWLGLTLQVMITSSLWWLVVK